MTRVQRDRECGRRGLKIGTLVLFTALTTSACHDGPNQVVAPTAEVTEKPGMLPRFIDPATIPPISSPASILPTSNPETPKYTIPSEAGTALLVWTAKGGKTQSGTITLFHADIQDQVLRLFTPVTYEFALQVQLPDEGLPEPEAEVRQLDSFNLTFRTPTGERVSSMTSELSRPMGTLEVAENDHQVLAGMFLLELNEGTLQLYFRAHHLPANSPDEPKSIPDATPGP